MNRRSFLSAVAAAIGVAVAEPIANAIPIAAPSPIVPPQIIPFTIWDSITLLPGEIVKARLFPPPTPKKFLVQRLGIHFAPETQVRDVEAMASTVGMQLQKGKLVMMAGPLCGFPFGYASFLDTRFDSPRGFAFDAGDDLGIYLGSDRAPEIEHPVTMSVIVDGLLRSL